jgi:predicted RNA-binding Zn-ribbon protein involved in translation (DUF1610 family)
MKKRSPKAGLFAAVPVKGPPCVKCRWEFADSKGRYWACPSCGHKEKKDTCPL